jgi:alpha-tubulin suppressor-like RCC1 family protein
MFILAKRVLCDWWKVVLLFGLTGVVNQLLAAQPTVVVSATPNVAGSSTFSLSSNGALYGWGADTYGQLGVGRISNSSTFLLTGSGFRSVSVGESHVAAIKTDNSLWTWGQNSYRQLGDGSSTAHSTPVKIGSDYQSVVAGSASTLGLKLDGTLWIWGQGFFGDGNWIGSSGVPVLVGSGYAAMATGGGHVLALKMDGTLWGWGPSQYGQLGLVANDICNPGTNSTYTCSFTKRLIGSGYIGLAAGAASSYALGIDGTLWAWGSNDNGQLGDGTAVQRGSPTKVGSNFASIAAGFQHAVAVKADGSLWAWGSGIYDPVSGQPARSPLRLGEGYTSVDAGGHTSFAIKSDGSLWAWGANDFGKYGDGSSQASSVPKQVSGGVAMVSAGKGSTAMVKKDGTLWIAGDNSFGELGLGTITTRSNPVFIGSGFTSVATGGGWNATWATKTDGSLWAWGDNRFGQYGDATSISSTTPKRIGKDVGFARVAAGFGHYVAIRTDGSLVGWGGNSVGQLGLGTTVLSSATPTLIGTGYSDVATGGMHTIALKTDGSLWTWGSNVSGALGVVSTETCQPSYPYPCASKPSLVGTGYKAISAGASHTVALKSDGALWAWGDNSAGQLGVVSTDFCKEGSNNTGTNVNHLACSMTPKLVGTGFASVSAGYQHTLAIKTDGSLWAWGTNYWGYLGDGGSTGAIVAPKKIGSGFTHIAAGGYASVAIKADGTVWSWGWNQFGNLGDGTLVGHLAPALVINETASGPLDLIPEAQNNIPADKIPPFFLVANGGITTSSATVSTTTKFNPADQGKTGSVFITATVPTGALGTTAAAHIVPVASAVGEARPSRAAAITPPSGFTLIQLTSTGWQTVVNGQLIPYTSGVLGDQLAAQTILNGTDTTNLKGAEFCVGYGTSAQDMVNNGNIRVVATIPGATTTASCVVGGSISLGISVLPGWNLLGNPVNQSITVTDTFGDPAKVTSVWKWDSNVTNWQFYAPGMSAAELQGYAASQGYAVLSEIAPGEGYWVSAKVQAKLGTLTGDAINLRQSSLASGWNLVSTASPISAKDFNLSLSTTPPTAGQVPINMVSLWAWDAWQSKWLYYAPSLEAQGGTALADFVKNQNYEDFAASGKTLGQGQGFWVKRP